MESIVRVAALTSRISLGDMHKSAEALIEAAQQLGDRAPDLVLLPKYTLTGGSLGDLAQNGQFAKTAGELHPYLGAKLAALGGLFLFTAPAPGGERAYLYREGQLLLDLPAETEPGRPLPTFSIGGGTAALFFGDPAHLSLYAREIVESGADLLLLCACEPDRLGYGDRVLRQIKEVSAALGVCCVLSQGGEGDSSAPRLFTAQTAVFECDRLLAFAQAVSGPPAAICDVDLDIIAGYRRGQTLPAFPRPEPAFSVPVRTGGKKLLRPLGQNPFITRPEQLDELFSLQVKSLAVRMENTGIKGLVVALSGGLDSTLALLVAAGACDRLGLPRSAVTAVTMPGFGTSQRTKSNAEKLCEAVGAKLRKIPIGPAVEAHFADIGHDPQSHNVTFENAQARERTQICLDIANETGALVVGTGDLSEVALGFCTFGGDALANFNVNICLPKTLVRAVCRRLKERFAKAAPFIQDILDTPVSPELLPPDEFGNIAQKTEEILGEYDLLDFILYHHLRYGLPPEKIFYYACAAFGERYTGAYIKEKLGLFYKRFCASQFKRVCAPECAVITDVTLSGGAFAMPGDMGSKTFLEAVEAISV